MDLQSQQNNLYTVLVAGDIDLSNYDLKKKVSPYVVYEYNKRKDIRLQTINIYKDIINNLDDNQANKTLKMFLNAKLQDLTEMTDEEYFEEATKGMTYDEKTGNALSTVNPNGRYKILQEPTIDTALPLIDGKFECFVKDIKNIPKNIDNEKKEFYESFWDDAMLSWYKNDYLNLYNNKETYVNVMCEPLFYNAFVSKETGWVEQGEYNQIEWVLNFKEKFINKLSDNTKIKVYNFIR